VPLRVPLTLSYDITQLQSLPTGYGISIFLVTDDQHTLLAAGSVCTLNPYPYAIIPRPPMSACSVLTK
jgi:hypothetical protein